MKSDLTKELSPSPKLSLALLLPSLFPKSKGPTLQIRE